LQEQKDWHSQEVRKTAENLKESIEIQKKVLTEEFIEKTTDLKNESRGMFAFTGAITIEPKDAERAFSLFFQALCFFHDLGAHTLTKICINRLNRLIDNKRAESLKLNRKQKEEMIEKLEKIKIQEDTKTIRTFLDSRTIIEIETTN
jgi:hypothetical protein